MTETATFRPDWVSPPGETIGDLLEERGWTQSDLAARTGFSRKHINALVGGHAALTADAALKLESTLGGSAQFWLAREAQYREALVRKEAEAKLSAEAGWLAELPLRHMIKFGWVLRAENPGAQVAECLRFFGVATVEAWREHYQEPLVAFRAASKPARRTGAIAAWMRAGEREARIMRCRDYDEKRFRQTLRDLRALTCEPDPSVFVPALKDQCAKSGVAVTFVPAPPGCPVSGATWWILDTRAVLQLSLRYRWNDSLWFTIFHEAAHILLHRRRLFIEGSGDVDEECEREADTFAQEELIPPQIAARLPTLKRSATAVTEFAKQIGIAPGIVVGRLQKEGLLPWTHLQGLKTRYQWDLPTSD